jgi:hypothetical protein
MARMGQRGIGRSLRGQPAFSISVQQHPAIPVDLILVLLPIVLPLDHLPQIFREPDASVFNRATHL